MRKNLRNTLTIAAATSVAAGAALIAAPQAANAATVTGTYIAPKLGTICLTTATKPGMTIQVVASNYSWSTLYRGQCRKGIQFRVFQNEYVKSQYGGTYGGGWGYPVFGDGYKTHNMYTTGTLRLTGHTTPWSGSPQKVIASPQILTSAPQGGGYWGGI